MLQENLQRKLKNSFSDVPSTFIDFCVSYGTYHQYLAKQFIYLAGDDPNKMYLLLKGSVQLILANEFIEKIYRILRAPSIFPEVVLDGKSHIHSAYVVEHTEVLVLETKSVEAFLTKSPETYKFFFKALALDYRRANRQIRNLSLGDARIRLGAKLYALAHAHGYRTSEGIELTLSVTTTELAGMCGLARESASRILTELKDLQIIKTEKKTILITNLEELRLWIYKRAQKK